MTTEIKTIADTLDIVYAEVLLQQLADDNIYSEEYESYVYLCTLLHEKVLLPNDQVWLDHNKDMVNRLTVV